MTARSVRCLLAALLLGAAGLAVSASAASVPSVRLDSARLFNPSSESLLAMVDEPAAQSMSAMMQRIFHLWNGAGAMAQAGPADSEDVAALSSSVNLNALLAQEAYVPRAVIPDIPAPRIAVASTQPSALPAPAAPEQPDSVLPGESLAALPNLPVRFGTYAPYVPQQLTAARPIAVRLGPLHVRGESAFRAMQLCGTTDADAACASQRDASRSDFIAGTNFNVRTGDRSVRIQLASSVEQMTGASGPAVFPYVPIDPDAGLGSGTSPQASLLQYPGIADLVRTGLAAGIDVPITHRLTLGLGYDRAHYQGDYGTSLLPGLDAYKNTYQGNVSYQLSNPNSLVTLSARQYRYQDGFSPAFNLTQTRADLNFTVKF